MSGNKGDRPRSAVVDRLRAVVWGRDDPRVRATYRVLLAWPVLWFLVGTVAFLVAGLVIPPDATKGVRMSVGGTFQAAFVAGALVVWARFLDRRPLADYGTLPERSWLGDALVGFGAVLVGSTVWLGAGSLLGWASVEIAPSSARGSLALGLAGVFVGVLANVWVQQTVFFGVALKDGAEGLANRGIDPAHAIAAAWLVAVVLFTLKHRPVEVTRWINLLVVLGAYGLLYVHTGDLALSIGVHTGVNYAGHTMLGDPAYAAQQPTLLSASTSLEGIAGSLSGGAVPHVLLAYLLLLGWIRWRHGDVGVATTLATWVPRGPAEPDDESEDSITSQ